MPDDYVNTFVAEDRERLFRLLALFARWESALKRTGFVSAGQYGQAEANWNTFADAVEAKVAALKDSTFTKARDYLLTKPPRRLCVENNHLVWRNNPRRQNETDARYFFRVVRDVRNNLFHGGKYQGGPEAELARDRQLIDCVAIVLEVAIDLDPRIRNVFEEVS